MSLRSLFFAVVPFFAVLSAAPAHSDEMSCAGMTAKVQHVRVAYALHTGIVAYDPDDMTMRSELETIWAKQRTRPAAEEFLKPHIEGLKTTINKERATVLIFGPVLTEAESSSLPLRLSCEDKTLKITGEVKHTTDSVRSTTVNWTPAIELQLEAKSPASLTFDIKWTERSAKGEVSETSSYATPAPKTVALNPPPEKKEKLEKPEKAEKTQKTEKPAKPEKPKKAP